jgi:5'-nucleotidase
MLRGPVTDSIQRRRTTGLALTLALGTAMVASAGGAASGQQPAAEAAAVTSLNPSLSTVVSDRFADTRAGATTVDGDFAGDGRIAAGGQYEVTIAGRGDVPAFAVGAIVEVTMVGPSGPGFATVHPCAPAPPNASALNYTTGVDVANEIFAALSASGSLCVYTFAESDLLIDVVGYVLPDDSVKLMTPARIAESRLGTPTVDGLFEGFGRTSPGSTTTVRVAGRAGVPTGISAAIVNVAAVEPADDGFISVDPCLPGTPTASSLNYVSGVNRANELIAEVDAAGNICIFTQHDVDLIVDVVGYVEEGSDLVSTSPRRFAETRDGAPTVDGQNQGGGKLAAESSTTIQITGRATVPAGAVAAIVNVAAVEPDAAGFFTVDGCNTPRAYASSLNYTAGVNGANELVVQLSSDGKLCVFTSASTHMILDVVGYLAPGPLLLDLQLLGFNDYHGHLESTTPGMVGGVPTGGAEFLSAKLNELRAGEDHSLTVAAGDLIGGSPAFSGLFHDEPSVESLNALELDVSSVGNHEFDEGVTELLRMQNGGCHPVDGCYFPSEPYPGADYQWLSANVVETATGNTPLPPYWIELVENVKVGFIGMTLEGTDELVAAAGIAGYDFLDEATTANALVPILKAHGVETIVVLLHEGGSQTPPPGDVDACVGISGPIVAINGALDAEIDAVITGHTHLPYNCVLDDPAGQPRIVTSAYSFGRVVTEIDLVLDRRSRDVRRDLSTSINHVVDQTALTADPAQTAIIAKWQPLVAAAADTPVGSVTADIVRGGTPPGDDRGVESSLGNLIADAQLWATSSNGADVALMNPGGLRADLLFAESAGEGDGVVTFGEAFTAQPFGNTLITFPMTGAQIVSVLEEQCQPAGSSRPFLHLGVSEGFTYDLATTFDATPDCTSVSVTNVMLNGVALNPAQTYNVTVNNFLADGGDNFDTFATITAPRLDGGDDLQALTNYLGTFSPVAPPGVDRVNEL